MKVIMISGKSGSGKDTFATFLKDELIALNKRVLVIHFADMVKEYAKLYYGWDGVKDEAGRTLLQQLGTDKVRAKYPTYWGRLVAQFISATAADWDYVLIPDLRFLNEYKTVVQYNRNLCSAIRITRYDNNSQPWLNPALTEEQHNHPSETDLDEWSFDWYIENAGSLEELQIGAKEFLKLITKE